MMHAEHHAGENLFLCRFVIRPPDILTTGPGHPDIVTTGPGHLEQTAGTTESGVLPSHGQVESCPEVVKA